MAQARRDVDLAQEALAAQHGTEFRPQQLEGDLAMMLEVLSEIDRGHPAATDLLFYAVAVGECRLEAFEQVGQEDDSGSR